LPYIAAAGAVKTKPTQHSVMKLREIGVLPDILICRTDREIPAEMRQKIAMFCNVDPGSVFVSPDVKSIYELPLELHRQGLDERLSEILNIWSRAGSCGGEDPHASPPRGGAREDRGGGQVHQPQGELQELNGASARGSANEVRSP
jgi:CTP synthase (UTP-ammonia lyase)